MKQDYFGTSKTEFNKAVKKAVHQSNIEQAKLMKQPKPKLVDIGIKDGCGQPVLMDEVKQIKTYQCECGEDFYEDDVNCLNCGKPIDKIKLKNEEVADIKYPTKMKQPKQEKWIKRFEEKFREDDYSTNCEGSWVNLIKNNEDNLPVSLCDIEDFISSLLLSQRKEVIKEIEKIIPEEIIMKNNGNDESLELRKAGWNDCVRTILRNLNKK